MNFTANNFSNFGLIKGLITTRPIVKTKKKVPINSVIYLFINSSI